MLILIDQCVAVTELKRNASGLIKSLKKNWNKIIFVNNKPVAVLSDIDDFDFCIEDSFNFDFWPEGVDPKVILDQLVSK